MRNYGAKSLIFIATVLMTVFFAVEFAYAEDAVKIPDIKVYSNQIILSKNDGRCRIFFDGTSVAAANALYDKKEDTALTAVRSTTVTIDAGELKALTALRFLPKATEDNVECIGARFLVSVDNKEFLEVSRIEADQDGALKPKWHTVAFCGYGFYRYFRIEIPAGASFGEVEWICDEGIKSDIETGRTNITCTAFDAVRDFKGTVLFAKYNEGKVLTTFETQNLDFKPGEDTVISYSTPLELGEVLRVIILNEKLEPATENTLFYDHKDASKEFSMPNIFSDNMLLQADTAFEIWGDAPCGSRVKIAFKDEKKNNITAEAETVVSSPEGWSVTLPAFDVGGNYTMTVTCGKDEKKYKNITFGDVWLFMGQSNMEYYMLMGEDTEKELSGKEGKKNASYPNIRVLSLLNEGKKGSGGRTENVPLDHWENFWSPMDVDHANYCSAIAYYFSKGVYNKYNRPVGILNVAVGDTEIDWWIPSGRSYGSFTAKNGRLYNNRIAPFERLKIKGILMYQGEADEYRTHLTAKTYSDALAGLIDTYRSVWGEEIPFYWAQVTRYYIDETEIREGQRLALQKVKNTKNTGMICLLDAFGSYSNQTGSTRRDIHPMGKEEAANRFLRFAGHDVYGDKCIKSGPMYESAEIVENTIEVSFTHTGSLKIMPVEQYADSQTMAYISAQKKNKNELQEFWIAGSDMAFMPAKAIIDDDKVVVWNDDIKEPKYVRYAWGAYPEMPNLTDDSGLPTSTFTTEY